MYKLSVSFYPILYRSTRLIHHQLLPARYYTALFTSLRDINMTDTMKSATKLVTDTLTNTLTTSHPNQTNSNHEYHVGTVEQYELDQPVEVELGQVKAVVIRTRSGIYALGNKCTHYGAPLNKSVVKNDRIKCPWHGACFHIATGDIEDAPACDPLPTYNIRIDNNNIYITAEQTDDNINSKRKLHTAIEQHHIQPVRLGNPDDNIVIVGGGAGSVGAVESLRSIGYIGCITVISNESRLPYDRTKLSKSPDVDKTKIELRSQQFYDEQQIKFIFNTTVTNIDTDQCIIHTNTNQSIPYHKLLICTGGSAMKLGVPGDDSNNIFTVRNPSDADAIINTIKSIAQCRVVVVGSGFIGMEIGAFLQKQKLDNKLDISSVTNINMGARPFEAVLGQQIGDEIMSWHTSLGIKFITNSKTTKFNSSSNNNVCGVDVVYHDGTTDTIAADVVIIGAGVKLNTSFLQDNSSFQLEKKWCCNSE